MRDTISGSRTCRRGATHRRRSGRPSRCPRTSARHSSASSTSCWAASEPMPGEERSNLPARLTLDRAALDRVLGRAAELAVASPDSLESLTEERVIEIGKEVGISEPHLRQALAEERTRLVVPEEPGIVAQYFGPGTASATRTVRGKPEAVLAALDRWMLNEECLQVKRRFPDRITWDARRDL